MTLIVFLRLSLSLGFNPCFSGSYIMTFVHCLIERAQACFNPCFSGSYIMTFKGYIENERFIGFNPCFSGSYIMTVSSDCQIIALIVSILVLVDLIL